MRWILLTALLATNAAADCPTAPDITAQLDALIDQARAAESEMLGREASQEMWALWTQAPDEAAQELLDKGMQQRSSYDFLGALETFDRLVAYCPSYAEGYNQRAFVNFLQGRFAPALEDLDKTIELSPKHIGALSGKALTLRALGDLPEAHQVMEEALSLNPWLSERHLMPIDPGRDI